MEEMAVLKYLQEKPNATQKEIAQHIGKSERTVKTMTVNLSERGIIERKTVVVMVLGDQKQGLRLSQILLNQLHLQRCEPMYPKRPAGSFESLQQLPVSADAFI